MTIADVRAVADAVLYEGYLLYPYRSTSAKNQARWQFGVLGPPGAANAGLGEPPNLSAQCLIRTDTDTDTTVTVATRFLQLQRRTARDASANPVETLVVDGRRHVSWDEAVPCEITSDPLALQDLMSAESVGRMDIAAGAEVEELDGGSLLRTRQPLCGCLRVSAVNAGDLVRLTVSAENVGDPAVDADDAIARSFIGAHMIVEVRGGSFVSVIDPPEPFAPLARDCVHHRAFPVVAGPDGEDHLMLISPIILYDHPEVAAQSPGALFDSTEIDEILTLRVMTMTDTEKEQARATDARAAEIIDRCEAMSPEAMAQLHGVLREPHLPEPSSPQLVPEVPDGMDWWDPAADAAVAPESDAVLVGGVAVGRGSRVRLRPSRRADAHDVFFAGMTARVMTVHGDVDGDIHVGVVIEDDPAADLHESFGRYFYFAPDEIEPLDNP